MQQLKTGSNWYRLRRVREVGKQDNGIESKANVSTTNVKSEKISRQEEGARIINAAFANAPVMDGEFAMVA